MEKEKICSMLYQLVMVLAIFPPVLIALIGYRYASGLIPAFVYLITGLAVCGVPIAGFILCASRLLAGKPCSLTCHILQIVYGGVLAGQIIFTIVGICLVR